MLKGLWTLEEMDMPQRIEDHEQCSSNDVLKGN